MATLINRQYGNTSPNVKSAVRNTLRFHGDKSASTHADDFEMFGFVQVGVSSRELRDFTNDIGLAVFVDIEDDAV